MSHAAGTRDGIWRRLRGITAILAQTRYMSSNVRPIRSLGRSRLSRRFHTRSRSRGSRRIRTAVVVVVITLSLLFPITSYARALNAPGAATWASRTVDWARDHGGAPVINAVENWYYTLHAPPNTAPAAKLVPAEPAGPLVAAPGPRAALPVDPGSTALPGEAAWFPHRMDKGGRPSIYTGFFRPDPAHQSVIAGAAWIRADSAVAHLVAGTSQPGSPFTGPGLVPPNDVSSLVATFNSGWRMKDIRGGFYLAGHTAHALVDGEATAAIDDTGHLTVGQWGRDLSMSPHLVAARQNLALIVDHGHLAPNLDLNASGQWGSPKNQFQYTSRSALGVDSAGNLIYVVGSTMSLDNIASSLLQAGAVKGMELDIHTGMQSFSTWDISSSGITPTRLLPSLQPAVDRYLAADQRDFFYLTLR